MKSPLSDERLAELAALPDGHPDVARVRDDPETWARLVALREFLSPSAIPGGARPDAATERLRAALRTALDEQAAPGRPQARAVARGRPWWVALLAPPARPWLAAAAGLAALVVVLAVPRLTVRQDQVRGRPGGVELAAPSFTPDRVVLSWRSVTGADAYEVRLLGADLAPVAQPIRLPDTTVAVSRAETLAGLGPGAQLHWRVSALARGTPIAESETRSFRLP